MQINIAETFELLFDKNQTTVYKALQELQRESEETNHVYPYMDRLGDMLDSDSTGSTEDEIPWGFSERSYQMCKSGVLDSFIPNGSEAEQCIIADLDMDGIDDVLLSYSIPRL